MNAAVRLVRLLRGKGLTVTTAESMTGGLIAGAITSVPGVPLPLCGHARGNPPEGRSGGAGAGLPRRGKGMRRRRFRRAGQTNRKGAVMWRTALSAGIAEN